MLACSKFERAQLVRASHSELQRAERHRFQPRCANYFLSLPFTLYVLYEFALLFCLWVNKL